MTESQVKQMQEMQEVIARLTESNNNLAQRVKKLESKSQKETK